MGSTRFPGKPLADLCGKPMVQWVVEAARRAGVSERVVVATPDPEIMDACSALDIEAMATSIDHKSGTDRIAEVARSIAADVYVNVQGDEPLIDPETIRACTLALLDDKGADIASCFCPCAPEDEANHNVVKVATDLDGRALYFSRWAVPFPRGPRPQPVKQHIGIYAYRGPVLQQFASWDPTPLELAESLEQLRFLEHGLRMKMVEGRPSAVAVDTPEQADQARALLAGLN